ncbi:MAG: TIR domain-containing protein [Gammaproteobacteria bacterium]|nr:TIR domain-containing protein [Gammaproteobacteria bacterium]
MSAIFLSYRRDDAAGYAGRLFADLSERFGRESVFMDIENLEPGMDFVAGIDRAIEASGAVIALIGPNWVNAQDGQGRRLDDPNDFIRLEINSALTRGVRVIPVLVHDAPMPREQELPEPLRPMCRLQAFEISDKRWEFDVTRLGDVLEPLISDTERRVAPSSAHAGKGGRTGVLAAIAAAVLLAVGGGLWWFTQVSAPGVGTNALSGGRQEPAPAEPVAPVDPRPAPGAATVTPTSTVKVEPTAPVAEPQSSVGDAGVLSGGPPDDRDLPSASIDRPAAVPPPEPVAEPAVPAVPEPDPIVVLPRTPGQSPVDGVTAAPWTAAPPVVPEHDERRGREIAELLDLAQADIGDLRLTLPAGNNAFERYQRVLELEPRHPAALRGLEQIVDRYHGLVEEALAQGSLATAQRRLDSARSVEPGAGWIEDVQREIDRRRHTLSPGSDEGRSAGDAARRQANCLAACAKDYESCTSATGPQPGPDCRARGEEECEARFQACMSDTSKMFLGPVSHESECAGVHARCMREVAGDCETAAGPGMAQCDARLEECNANCRRSN